MQDLNTMDVMQYLLKDVDLKEFKDVTIKTTIDRIKKDCNVIQVKMFEALKNDNIGTYNNLQKALVNNINAIKSLEADYTTVYSEYETKENPITGKVNKQVAIWEQNSDGEIRNRKSWDVKESADSSGLTAETIEGNIVGNVDKSKSFYEEWECRFLEEHETQGKKTTYPILKNIRNIGKTTFLVKQAVKNKGIYVCSTKEGCLYAKNIDDRVVVVCGKGAFEVFDDSKLFIDEGIELRNIKNLENVKEYFVFKLYN